MSFAFVLPCFAPCWTPCWDAVRSPSTPPASPGPENLDLTVEASRCRVGRERQGPPESVFGKVAGHSEGFMQAFAEKDVQNTLSAVS